MKTAEDMWEDCLKALQPHERPTNRQEELRMKIVFMDGGARAIAEMQSIQKKPSHDS